MYVRKNALLVLPHPYAVIVLYCVVLSLPRFPNHFIDDVHTVVDMIIKEIADRFIKEPPLIKSLNTSLAFFLHDLLSLMDRGFVFQLIMQYCRKVSICCFLCYSEEICFFLNCILHRDVRLLGYLMKSTSII